MQGSAYSPFLHDAVYLYLLALNHTLGERDGDPHNGAAMFRTATQLSFQGSSRNCGLENDELFPYNRCGVFSSVGCVPQLVPCSSSQLLFAVSACAASNWCLALKAWFPFLFLSRFPSVSAQIRI